MVRPSNNSPLYSQIKLYLLQSMLESKNCNTVLWPSKVETHDRKWKSSALIIIVTYMFNNQYLVLSGDFPLGYWFAVCAGGPGLCMQSILIPNTLNTAVWSVSQWFWVWCCRNPSSVTSWSAPIVQWFKEREKSESGVIGVVGGVTHWTFSSEDWGWCTVSYQE